VVIQKLSRKEEEPPAGTVISTLQALSKTLARAMSRAVLKARFFMRA